MGALVHPPVIGGSRAVKLASSAPGRRGLVVAGSPVAEGDDILAIRLRYTLSDAAIIDGCRCPLPAAVREESWEVRLGATMLWAARAGPPGLRRLWRRYVRLLPPASEGCSGLVASDLALALTRAPHLVASLESRRRKIDEVFSMHLAHRPDLGCRSADELRWAAASVESRAFQAHGPHGWAREAFMLPFVDMCNHAADPNASVEFPARPESDDWATSDARVCLRAMRRIALGEEVVISYGSKPSLDMWAQYGFFDPGNPDCVVCPDAVIADAGLTGVQLSPPALRRALSSRFWDKHPTVVSDGLESDAASEGRAEVVLASLVEQFGWKSMRAFRETRSDAARQRALLLCLSSWASGHASAIVEGLAQVLGDVAERHGLPRPALRVHECLRLTSALQEAHVLSSHEAMAARLAIDRALFHDVYALATEHLAGAYPGVPDVL